MFGSGFTGCTREVGLKTFDACIGGLYLTPLRVAMATFTPTYLEDNNIYLVVREESANAMLLSKLFKTFAPFVPSLWLLIALACLAVGFMMWWVGEVGPMPLWSGMFFATGISIMRVGNGGIEKSKTRMGKIFLVGFGIFTMQVLATYTANLTSLLVLDSSGLEVSSIEEAAAKDKRVCVPSMLLGSLNGAFPAYKDIFVEITGTLEGPIEGMDIGKCDAAVSYESMYARSQSGEFPFSKAHCDKAIIKKEVLLTLSISTPVNRDVESTWTYLQTKLELKGEFQRLWQDTRFAPKKAICKDRGEILDEAVALKPTDLLAVFACLGVCLLVGALLHCYDQRKGHRGSHSESGEAIELAAIPNPAAQPLNELAEKCIASQNPAGQPLNAPVEQSVAAPEGQDDANVSQLLKSLRAEIHDMRQDQLKLRAEVHDISARMEVRPTRDTIIAD